MGLTVDIEKTLGAFELKMQFTAGDGVLALLGASGCGKSMTLKCIAGVVRPDRGHIELDGRVLYDSAKHICLPPQARRVGYLFQQYALFPNMTVRQNIACGVRDKRRRQDAVPPMIARMRLEGMEEKRPSQLSGGQQQRVALARILVNEPDLLLLDEPFSALDSHLRFQMEQEVRQVVRSFRKPVILVSHNRDEVYRLSSRVAIVNDGHVEALDENHAVFSDPKTRSGAVLTGCKNISRAERRSGGRVYAVDWGMELAAQGSLPNPAYVGIRMHDIRPLRTGEAAENACWCRVEEVIENPFSYTVMLRPEGVDVAQLIGWETEKSAWRRWQAERLRVQLPPEAILLLKA